MNTRTGRTDNQVQGGGNKGTKGAVGNVKNTGAAALATVKGVRLPGGNLPSKRRGAKSGKERGIVT